jgi:predicted amidohydrolase/GNAT superfamily N-acetyltransferase
MSPGDGDGPEVDEEPSSEIRRGGEPLDVSEFETSIQVRNLRLEDYPFIEAISLACYPDLPAWPVTALQSQLERFPEGQFGVEVEGRIVAVAFTLIVEIDVYHGAHTWGEITDRGFIRNHDPEGDTLYGVEIMVHPDFRNMRLARRLYDARKALCHRLNLRRIMFGGRVPGYATHQAELTPREYVEAVGKKVIFDKVLTTQLANGFVVKRLIQGYLAEDKESAGVATLMEWVNLDYQPSEEASATERRVRICVVQYRVRPLDDWQDFSDQCEYFVDVASGYNADLCVFPELITCQLLSPIDEPDPALAVRKVAEYTEEYLDLFGRLAVRYNINILGGSHYTLEGDDLYNVAYLFQRNGQINRQYKLHISPDEKLWWGVQGGSELEVFDTDCGRIAIHIGGDVNYPELTRLAVERGAELVLVPFATAERQGYLRIRLCAQARCIENQVYAAIAGTVGNLPFAENFEIQYAQSGIFTPSDFEFARDAVAAECTPNVETVVLQDVDLNLLGRYRQRSKNLTLRDRRTDLYRVVAGEEAE